MSGPTSVEERCPRSDLPKYSCSHCRGHTREEKPRKVGELYRSTKPSTCSACGRTDPAGERIATDGEGGHVCEDCHKDLLEELKSHDDL